MRSFAKFFFHCKNIPAIDARVNAPRELRCIAARDRGLRKLFTDDFYQHTFAPPAVELTVKNLLPWTEIQFTLGDRDHDFSSHHLPFDVCVGIVLAGIVVSIAAARSSTSSALKKSLETAAQQRRRKKFESCARYDLPRGLVR